MTTRPPHLTFESLVDLADGRSLAPAEAREHLAACAECRGELERLGALVAAMREDPSEDPPPYAVAAALRAFDDHRSPHEVEVRVPLLRRVLAAISFESSSSSPAFGFRSADAAERSALYQAGDVDVQLAARPTDGEWAISGQVLGECEGGTAVVTGPSGEFVVPLTELCEFAVGPVPPGTYSILIRLADAEIVLPDLTLE